jgi:hypothetical protein
MLLVKYLASQWQGPISNTTGNTATFSFPAEYDGFSATGTWPPTELYLKVVFKVPSNTWNQSNSGSDSGYFTWWTSVQPGESTAWQDHLALENYFRSSANPQLHGTVDGWPAHLNGGEINYSYEAGTASDYHTSEMLTTSDKITNLYNCIWVDGVFKGCVATPSVGQIASN